MKQKIGKERLDKLLVMRGLAETRAKAQALILAGQVFSGQLRLDKAGQLVPVDIELTIREPMPFVSRGGLKLAAALDHFGIEVAAKSVSTSAPRLAALPIVCCSAERRASSPLTSGAASWIGDCDRTAASNCARTSTRVTFRRTISPTAST